MPMPLEKWQEQLERHFESLARTRADSGFPIFALEHGLTDEQLEEISILLRARLASGQALTPHWLPWVIYATERGYTYTGDEYWQSFEEHTPQWDFLDRNRVKPWFRKFRKAYHGVEPSGPWAVHFSIIAWPITHAVLPRYLQRQFARALYDLRYHLAGLDTLQPAAIGRLLAANSSHASTRFEAFLQQEELTGRIVLALLGAPSREGKEPLYPRTLQRIVGDLVKIRSARGWLNETQRVVRDRFKGIGRGPGPPAQPVAGGRDERAPVTRAQANIRPSLLLRYAGKGTWSVAMEVPSFKGVAAISAEIQAFVRRTRCRLNGANDVKPASWLLSGIRKGVLKQWPDLTRPLIQFEQSHAIVDHLLDSECRLDPGPFWLFRVGGDGTAREIASRIVRPGGRYLVVTSGELPVARAFTSPCTVDCSGIKSFQLLMPADVSAEDTAWLHKLKLQVARTIRVWPAGLPGRGWDGEGNSEWLTTEQPCFGIVHDHPVDAYELRLNGGAETLIEAGKMGQPLFVKLPSLSAGTHFLRVKARRSAALDTFAPSPPAEGFVQLRVREPEPWIPGALSHAGLIVTLDPHDANLDTFWKNEVKLSVLGPESHSVVFTVSLEARDGQEIFSEQLAPAMELPVKPEVWAKRFAQLVRRSDCAWSYLEAASGRLTIKGETLGECVLRFEHDVLPLRWVLRHDGGKIVLRLVDDSGQEDSEPKVLFLSMEHPLRAEACPAEKARSGLVVAQSGGVFSAEHGEHSDTVLVSAGLTTDGLQGLSVRPEFTELRNGSVALAESLRMLELWEHARLSGFLADIRRQQVTGSLVSAIYEILCGPNWARAEAVLRANPGSQQAIDALQRTVDKHSGFAAVLRRDHTSMDADFTKAARWFADLAARYHACTDRNTSEFALQLASQPHRLPRLFGGALDGLLNAVADSPVVLRGARFLALLSANQNYAGGALPLPRWKW